MKRILFILMACSSFCYGQSDYLSLDSCYSMAKRNYPLIKQNKLIAEMEKNAIETENKNWLPKLSFNSKATFQSEVISFGGQSFPKDNYISSLDLEQSIFEGGQIKQQKQIDRLSSENQRLNNEVELYKLVDKITQLYSSILISRENIKTLTLYKTDINNKINNLSAGVKNGLSLQSNLDEFETENLKTEQSIIEAKNNLTALYQTLAMYIYKTVSDETILSIDVNLSPNETISRPELKFFETQKSLLTARHKLNSKLALPKLTVSAQGAYGRPGPNFLNQDLRFFAQGGLNLRWNIGSLYTLSNESQNTDINKKMVDIQKETFEFNIKTILATQAAQINSLKEVIEKDKLIIEKRHNITLASASQLENGSITSSDYLVQLNAEMQAILNQKMHEIKLMSAITNYNTAKGNNNLYN